MCNVLFVFLCIKLIGWGSLDLAIFYSVYSYKNSVMDFAVRLGNLQDYFKEMEVNAYRVFQLADSSVYIHDRFGDQVIENYKGNIEFKDVYFWYVEGEPILNGISFKIKKNTHVAFVGASGCCKSTIVALICKLYEPQHGKILFDGMDANGLAQKFGENISMVNQYPCLFNLTIREKCNLLSLVQLTKIYGKH